MKALVLSGGRGTGLRPITYTMAKQLVPVANKPVLFHCLEALRDAGVTETGIVIGETGAEVRSAVGDGSKWGMRVSYLEQDAPRGLAHAVLVAREFLGDEPFVMYLGDNVLRSGIRAFLAQFLETRPDALVLLSKVHDPQRFGVAEIEGGRVARLVEKPSQPRSDLALVGVYFFTKAIHDAVRAIKPSWRGELEITDAIQRLVDGGRVVSFRIVEGWWKDTGKVEDLLEANRLLLDGQERRVEGEVDAASEVTGSVIVPASAKVTESVLSGPIVIGENCRIARSFVGPYTSVYHDVEIEDSELEDSIVLENTAITGVKNRIRGSLIGKNAVVRRDLQRGGAAGEDLPALRLVLGDNSQVGVS